MNINDIKKIVNELSSYNEKFASGIAEPDVVLEDARLLRSKNLELERIKRAQGTRTALGIFGQTQCGKSYLTSELIGGADSELIIEGINNPKYQNYNQINAAKESTALVTRITSISDNYNPPEGHVLVRFLSPAEIMWSFVYGFYNELDWNKGFEIDEDEIKSIKESIKSDDGSGRIVPDIEILADEFSECLSWINKNRSYPYSLADDALDYFNKNEKISIEKYVQLVSTLWHNDKNITNTFNARIEMLYDLGFVHEGSIPEKILKQCLDASTLNEISIKFDKEDIFNSDKGKVLATDSTLECITNLQAVIKEICLLTVQNDDALTEMMDILDFPGSRALTGLDGSPDADVLNQDCLSGKSKIIANAYKRGKLLYLFELYKKDYEISLLLFCSECGIPPGAPILSSILSKWIDMYENDENEATDPSLFVGFTKSDKLLHSSNNENKNDANNRISARFRENFEQYYGPWTSEYVQSKNPFQNIYFVRNPQADNECFNIINNVEEWRRGYEQGAEIFKNVFMNNEMVNKYLGRRKELIYKSVFSPGCDGIELLKQNILKKFEKEPDKKEKNLDARLKSIINELNNYIDKYHTTTNEVQAKEKEKQLARDFIEMVKSKYNNISIILNTVHENCPRASYLSSLITSATEPVVGQPIQIGTPLKTILPGYIDHWFKSVAKQRDLSDKTEIEKSDINKFLLNIKKYLLNPDSLKDIIKPFTGFDLIGNPAHVRALRNYLIWHVGEKIYFLEYREDNSTPEGPIKIPQQLNFNEFILNVWSKQLPEIYAGNFEMMEPAQGDEVIADIRSQLIV